MPKPPKQREAGPATDSSGYARRHRGSRTTNRTGPRRSMRKAACTCSVRAAASPAVEFPGRNPLSGFSAGPLGSCPARSSGAQVPVPNSDLEPPGAPGSSPACLAPPACCFVSFKHLEMFSPRCPQQANPYYRVGASESTCCWRREEGRETPG